MKRAYLVLSSGICVVLLLFVSFNSVISQIITTPTSRCSPLFQKRSDQAKGESDDALVTEYLGKEKINALPFPKREVSRSRFYQAVQVMQHIDKKQLDEFLPVIKRAYTNEALNNKKLSEIQEDLLLLHEDATVLDGSPLIGGWTIINPICLLIIFGCLMIFEFWLTIVSAYMGITCDPCCFVPLPDTVMI